MNEEIEELKRDLKELDSTLATLIKGQMIINAGFRDQIEDLYARDNVVLESVKKATC